jgi:hypothetical protein
MHARDGNGQATHDGVRIEVASIVIRGAGAGISIIDANHLDGVVRVERGRQARIESVTIRNGRRLGDSGGGIQNSGALYLVDSELEDSFATIDGGGIFSDGVLVIERSTISSNSAGRHGGGIGAQNTTYLRDSTVYGNAAGGDGGGIFSGGRLDVVNGTISYNSAGTDGGGVSSGDAAYLYSSTVIGNDADHDRDEDGGIGGGIHAHTGSLFGLVNALVADNTLRDAPIYNDCSGVFNSSGRNLFHTLTGDGGGCTFIGPVGGSVSTASLGALRDNGGPTLTHALASGNEAIDAAIGGCIDGSGGTLATDQRGAARIVGPRCDVGAFEAGASIGSVFRNGFE